MPHSSYSRYGHHGPPRHRHRRPYGGRGRGGSRARRGDVRAAILVLLDERPMHGYEMITELEQRTSGAWRPSAGSIYPTLSLLEDEGLVAGEEADGKRRFVLTDAGRNQVGERRGPSPWDEVTSGTDPGVLELGRSARRLSQAVGQLFHAADAGQRQLARELLDETTRGIYGILAEDSAADAE